MQCRHMRGEVIWPLGQRGASRTSADARWRHGNLFTEAISNIIFSAAAAAGADRANRDDYIYIRAASIVCFYVCIAISLLVMFTTKQLGKGAFMFMGEKKN